MSHSTQPGHSQRIQWCIFYVGPGTKPPNIEAKLEAIAKVGDDDGFFVASRHNPASPGPHTSWSPNQKHAKLLRRWTLLLKAEQVILGLSEPSEPDIRQVLWDEIQKMLALVKPPNSEEEEEIWDEFQKALAGFSCSAGEGELGINF